MRGVFIVFPLVTLFYLVSCCEKETHYLKDDKCCKMCGPGKRMLVDDNCEDPRCQDCEDGEYQSGYTSKTKCERQPSCDTNLHFLSQMNPSKTSLSKCQCQPGYYCTQDDDCNTCREHTVCKPGQKVIKKGSAVSDNKCEACKNGTFSTHDSADTCKEWTICEHGYDKNAPGSSTSDRICVDGTPNRRVEIGLGVAAFLLAIIAVAGVLVWLKRDILKDAGNQTVSGPSTVCLPTFFKTSSSMFHRRKKLIQDEDNKSCKELSQKITGISITRLEQDADVERAIQPLNQQPEEDDDSTPVSPTLSNVTENGYPVQQEHGKESVSSHPESNSVL